MLSLSEPARQVGVASLLSGIRIEKPRIRIPRYYGQDGFQQAERRDRLAKIEAPQEATLDVSPQRLYVLPGWLLEIRSPACYQWRSRILSKVNARHLLDDLASSYTYALDPKLAVGFWYRRIELAEWPDPASGRVRKDFLLVMPPYIRDRA